MTRCLDCGLPYGEFPLLVTLPDEQWQWVHPRKMGVLCARCIIARATTLLGTVPVRARLEFTKPAPQPTEPFL